MFTISMLAPRDVADFIAVPKAGAPGDADPAAWKLWTAAGTPVAGVEPGVRLENVGASHCGTKMIKVETD